MTNYGLSGVTNNGFLVRNNVPIKQFIKIKLNKLSTFCLISKLLPTINCCDGNITYIVDIITNAIGRYMVTLGIEDSLKIISEAIILSVYNDLDEHRILNTLDIDLLESNFLEDIIKLILSEFNKDVKEIIGNVSIDDMFTLEHEEYTESDYVFFKLDDNNIITIIKI